MGENHVMVNARYVDREKFLHADELVRVTMRQLGTGSQTIREIIDELNQNVIESAASQKSEYQIIQEALRIWWTLTGTQATTILKKMQKDVDDMIRETKKQQERIAADIRQSNNLERRLKTELSHLKTRTDNFDYAIQIYQDQISEINSLLAREGVELRALSPDYTEMSAEELMKQRSEIKDKILSADVELQGLYAEATDLGGRIEQTQRTTRIYESQYRQSLANRSNHLRNQVRSYAPELVSIMKRQAEMAQMEEDIEQRVKTRNNVAEVLFSQLEQSIDQILSPHKAGYQTMFKSESARDSINQALDEYAEDSYIRGDSQRTEAYAAFNKHLE